MRRRARLLAPLVACGLSAAGISCAGDCWPSTSPVIDVPPGPTPVLQPRYVATFANGASLPYALAPSGGAQVRLLADTLVFTGAGTPPAASGTYVEIRTIGTTQGSGPEVVTTTRSAARAWRRGTTYALLELDDFVGIGTTAARASIYLGNEQVPTAAANVIVPGGSIAFEPR